MHYGNMVNNTIKRATIILVLFFVTFSVGAQVLEGEVVQDPRSGLAIYDFHFDDSSKATPFYLLPHFPNVPDILPPFPNPFTPWVGEFILPNQTAPLFSFNLRIENQSLNELNLSDGGAVINGIDPGITCHIEGGCDPIMFVLPINYEPLIDVNFPIQVELNAANIFSQPVINEGQSTPPQPILDFGFIDPFQPYLNQDLLEIFPPQQVIDPLIDPRNPLFTGQFTADPLGTGFASLPLPPDPRISGLSLSLQGLVLDPVAPTLAVSGLQQGQTVNLGNSFHIQVSPVPEPGTLFLITIIGIWLYLRKKQTTGGGNAS